MASSTKNIRLGVCNVYFGSKIDGGGKLTLVSDLGFTQGGVEVTVSTETHKVNVDQYGKSTVAEYIQQRDIKVKVPMAETTLDNLAIIMPGVELSGAATGTTAALQLGELPVNAKTITITAGAVGAATAVGAKTYTFKDTPAGVADVQIAPLTNLSGDGLAIVTSGAVAGTSRLPSQTESDAAIAETQTNLFAKIFADFTTALGWGAKNALGAITLKATTDGAVSLTITTNITSGITIDTSIGTNASAAVKRCATVTNGVGTNLLDIAQGLLLRPIDKTDGSDDLFIPSAATAGAMNFAYQVDKERIFNAEFTGYPYSPSNGVTPNDTYLFKIGDVAG